MSVPALPVSAELAQRLSGSPILVALDIDGTLAPIAPTPAEARVPETTREILRALRSRPDVRLAVVSGRAAADAGRLVGVDRIWVIGNHGMECVTPEGERRIADGVAPFEVRVSAAARDLRRALAAYPTVLLEDKKLTLSVHYRLAPRQVVAPLTDIVRRVAVMRDLRVVQGKEVLELRPPVATNKGTAVIALAHDLGFEAPAGPQRIPATKQCSIIYAGDDQTDEDAFRELRARMPGAITVRILDAGNGPDGATHAEYSLSSPADLAKLLGWIAHGRRADMGEPS